MPFRQGIGKELTRSTICVKRSRGTVTLMCSDRVPAGAPSELLVVIDWTNFDGDVTLTFRKVAAGGGEIRFDAAAGPASRTFSGKVSQVVRIFGVTPTAGSAPDVMLDVTIEKEVIDQVPISVGPVATTVAIFAEDGAGLAPATLLPETPAKFKAVPNPAGAGTFRWATMRPAALAISGSATAETVEVRPAATGGPGGGDIGVCVLFTPANGPGVMAVHRTFTLFDPDRPGPFPVGRTSYTAPDFTIPGGREGWPAPVRVSVEALVRYPAQAAGNNTPFSTRKASYPLVILAHGRHGAAEFEREADGRRKTGAGCSLTPVLVAGVRPEFKNFEGLEYLASHLASHGFIAVSVNLNGKYNPLTAVGDISRLTFRQLTCHTFDRVGIAHRGLTINQHVNILKAKNGADPLFQGKIDVARIGLIGHSRGGEAVVAAHVIDKPLPDPVRAKYKAIASIAPTDFRGHVPDVPYLTLVGADDGDVAEAHGLRLYDRATASKQLVWVNGGIHNYFSSNWHWQDEVPTAPPVSRPQHEAIAKAYCNLFLQAHLLGITPTTPWFAGDRRIPSLSGVELHHAVRLPGGLVVDDFETTPRNKASNALSLPVVATDVASFDETALNKQDNACVASQPSWHQDTNGLMLHWSAATARYRTDLAGADVSARRVLSFRVGQDRTVNPPGVPQDFRIILTDTDGKTATLRVADFAVIPPPRTKNVIAGFTGAPACAPIPGGLTLCWLKTVRIPLARFKTATPALKLNTLAAVTFAFSATPAGRIAIDDLEFGD